MQQRKGIKTRMQGHAAPACGILLLAAIATRSTWPASAADGGDAARAPRQPGWRRRQRPAWHHARGMRSCGRVARLNGASATASVTRVCLNQRSTLCCQLRPLWSRMMLFLSSRMMPRPRCASGRKTLLLAPRGAGPEWGSRVTVTSTRISPVCSATTAQAEELVRCCLHRTRRRGAGWPQLSPQPRRAGTASHLLQDDTKVAWKAYTNEWLRPEECLGASCSRGGCTSV